MAHRIQNPQYLFLSPDKNDIARHVRREYRQITGRQSNRAFSNDYPAIIQLLKGVVRQIEKHFRDSKHQIQLLVNRGAVVRCPIHDTFELLIKPVGFID